MKKRVLACLLVLTFVMATMLGGCGIFGKKEESITASRGMIKDGRYINETFDFSFAVTEDMTPLTDSELADVGNLTKKPSSDSGYTIQEMELMNEGLAYDAMIYMPDLVTNILISYENMDITNEGVWVKQKTYAEIAMERMKTEEDCTILTEPYEVEVGGKEYVRFDLQSGWATQSFLVRQEKNYMVLILFTHKDNNAWVEEVVATFSSAQ